MKNHERFNERAARIANRFEQPRRQAMNMQGINMQFAGQQPPGYPLPLIQEPYEADRRRR